MARQTGYGHGLSKGIVDLPNGGKKCLDCGAVVPQASKLESLACGQTTADHRGVTDPNHIDVYSLPSTQN